MEKKNWVAQDYIHSAFQNKNLIDQLWCEEDKISMITAHAVQGCSVNDENNALNICCDYLIDYICVYLIKKPSDFLYIFKEFETEDKISFMNLYFQNYLVNPMVINALLNNQAIIEQIGAYHYWIEYPLKYRATKLIKNSPPTSLTASNLFPLELQLSNELKDYLLSYAYAENKLAKTEIEYFQQNFSRSYEMLTQAKQRGK